MVTSRGAAVAVFMLGACALAAAAVTGQGERTGERTRDRSGKGSLRVCADPNNLPFTNDRLEGFENRLADIVARDLGVVVDYTWWAQRRGFLRNTLNAGQCDVVLGLPEGIESALTTRPYYRSSYVFVYRADRGLRLGSLDDHALRRLRIGVQLVGDDGANSPPAHALSRRGLTGNVVGYSVYGDYGQPNPPARIVDAVADGVVDVAIVWGPLGGFFARRATPPLHVVPLRTPADRPSLPFTFAIAMGVRRGDTALRDRLNGVIVRRRSEIDTVLHRYGIPRAGAEAVSR